MASEPDELAESDAARRVHLISSHQARILLGRSPTCYLAGLKGFPEPSRHFGRTAFYLRRDVEAWHAAEIERRAAPQKRRAAERAARAERERQQREKVERERAAIHTTTFRIGLPKEFDVVRSLRRDLFDEEPRTRAPAPCGHWRVLLHQAGAFADGRDISPAMLAQERESDRQHHPRTRLSVGHRVEIPRPEDIESAAPSPRHRQGNPTIQRISLAAVTCGQA